MVDIVSNTYQAQELRTNFQLLRQKNELVFTAGEGDGLQSMFSKTAILKIPNSHQITRQALQMILILETVHAFEKFLEASFVNEWS